LASHDDTQPIAPLRRSAHTTDDHNVPLLPLAALMFAASINAWAQTPPPPPPPAPAPAPATAPTPATEGKTLKTVTVTDKAEAPLGKDVIQTKQTTVGKGTQDIRDIPQSVNIITEKLIDDAKLDTLKQALHYTAGITFAATENGTDQDIRMRGFPVATTGDLLIDGMRDPSQYDRDTFNYDRIEVMRGSASMIYGRGSTGGVINQVNKQPFLFDQYEIEGSAATQRAFRATADLNKRTGEDAALRVNLMGNRAHNGGAEINKRGIAPTYRFGIGERNEFSIGAFDLDVDNVPKNGVRYLGGSVATKLDPGNFYGKASDYLLGHATYANASWIHRFDDRSELKTQFRSGIFERSQWSTTAGFGTTDGAPTTQDNLSDATILTRSGLSPRKDRYQGTYLQSDYSAKRSAFGFEHQILAGVDVAEEKANRLSGYGNGVTNWTNYNKGNTTVGTPDDGTYTPASPLYRRTSHYSGRSGGIYAQDLMQVAPAWKLLLGGRLDSFRATVGQITYGTDGNIATTPGSRLSYPSLFSYRGGLLFQPTSTASFHLSYGTSFNTSVDTYQYTTQQTANTPAEKSRNVELGAKLDWLDGNLSTRAAIYRSEKTNERTTDADFAGTAFLLSGKRHSQGLELDVVGRVTPALEVYVSYSYIPVARIDRAGSSATAQASVGQRVGLTPKHTGSVWLSYQAMPKLRIAGGLRAVSENRPLSGMTGAAMATNKAPGYAAVDLMAEYQFSDTLQAQFNATNIGNRTYGDQLYPGFVVLGDPRSFRLTLTKRF